MGWYHLEIHPLSSSESFKNANGLFWNFVILSLIAFLLTDIISLAWKDMTEGLLGKACLFADETKVCNRVDIPGDISNMENDLALLENWSKNVETAIQCF